MYDIGLSKFVQHLLIDPETRWIVEKIFDLAVHGRGAASITRILVEDGILRLDAGSGNMSIFRLAATGREKRVRYLIYLWYGV